MGPAPTAQQAQVGHEDHAGCSRWFGDGLAGDSDAPAGQGGGFPCGDIGDVEAVFPAGRGAGEYVQTSRARGGAPHRVACEPTDGRKPHPDKAQDRLPAPARRARLPPAAQTPRLPHASGASGPASRPAGDSAAAPPARAPHEYPRPLPASPEITGSVENGRASVRSFVCAGELVALHRLRGACIAAGNDL